MQKVMCAMCFNVAKKKTRSSNIFLNHKYHVIKLANVVSVCSHVNIFGIGRE